MWLRIKKTASGRRKTTRLYRIWQGMRARCYRKTDTSYPYYGAKGITVCAEWGDYAVFRAWAVANGYGPEMTIDRKSHTQDYSPDTCRWVHVSRQQFNTRRSIRLTVDGVTRSLPHWARIAGQKADTIRWRVKHLGWTHREAIFTPLGVRRKEFWTS